MRVVIVGGGTGGHVYPGIAVAQELRRWDPRARIMFIGSRGGLEREIVAREGYRHFEITSSGLVRRRWQEQAMAAGHLLQGFGEAIRVLRRVQPQVILGLGSYVSGSVMLAASALGIPDESIARSRRQPSGCVVRGLRDAFPQRKGCGDGEPGPTSDLSGTYPHPRAERALSPPRVRRQSGGASSECGHA